MSTDEEKIIVTCPACKGKLRVPSNRGKLDVTCPLCKKVFRVDSSNRKTINKGQVDYSLRKSIIVLQIIMSAILITAGGLIILALFPFYNESVEIVISKYTAFIAILAVLCVSAVFTIAIVIHKKRIRLVETTSTLLKRIMSINGTFHFNDIRPQCTYYIYCSSKHEYDSRDLPTAIRLIASGNRSSIESTINMARYNESQFRIYSEQVSLISYHTDDKTIKRTGLTKASYYKHEDELYSERRLKPVTKTAFQIVVDYSSPQGRNNYHKVYQVTADDFINCFKNIEHDARNASAYEDHVRTERAKMTDSLRYDIMRRDGFRCQICGATAQDGAKLHVDHIKPVSKGGKTEPSNLRTLCNRCNIGKSAKYDPNGMN